MCAAKQSFKSEHPVNPPNLKNDKRIADLNINNLDGMLTIGQVSMLTGVNKTRLRYWERIYKKFIIPNRKESSHRQYSLKDVKIIKTIKKLQDNEYLTIKGISLRLNDLFPHNEDET